MPPVSENQRRAMYAAKEGHSTIGIPQKVGAEFVAADPGGKLPKRVKSPISKPHKTPMTRGTGSSAPKKIPVHSGGYMTPPAPFGSLGSSEEE
jgi:hypothetical protein